MFTAVFAALTATGALTLVLLTGWNGRAGATATDAPPLSNDEVQRHILWGAFYANPADPRGWLPKPSGFGVTPNFRTRERALVFAAIGVETLLAAIGLTVCALLGL